MAVDRPVVRGFEQKSMKKAAEYVRSGGHAFVWEHDKRGILLFQTPAFGNEEDLGAWGVYDMSKFKWHDHTKGALKGLSSSLVPRDLVWIAKRRVERDAVHAGPTRAIDIDCTMCAACCRDNAVILLPPDVKRFQDAGRPELAKPPYAKKRKDGRLVLKLLPNKRCQHLKRDNRCEIYAIRPHPCSEFPMGSENCLSAREDVLGISDGVAATDT